MIDDETMGKITSIIEHATQSTTYDMFDQEFEFNIPKALYWISVSLDRVASAMRESNELKKQELDMRKRERIGIPPASTLSHRAPESKPGVVYLLRYGNHCKIGMTTDLRTRIQTINTSLTSKVELLHTIETNNHIDLERELHERFAAKRCNGEWFLLDEQDIEQIKTINYETPF